MNEAYINIMEQEKQLQLHITKNDRKIITDFANSLSDKEYQLRCMWAIQILESKLTMINLELQENLQREVVVRLTHRIKSAESIFLKLRRKGYTINLDNAKKKLNDIVGVRVTCIFRDDIYALVDCLKIQHDIKILKIKDYQNAEIFRLSGGTYDSVCPDLSVEKDRMDEGGTTASHGCHGFLVGTRLPATL